MVLIVLVGFCYALYRLAVSKNITPWKWITRYVAVFIASFFVVAIITSIVIVMNNANPENLVNDPAFVKRVNEVSGNMVPFVFLYQFGLYFFFRLRIVRYVHNLDQIDKISDAPPTSPTTPKKEEKDLSYFR
jgi:hypothetical protein